MKYNWPTREEWAKDRRTLYSDEDQGFDYRLAEHASEAEISAAIAALETLWRDLGRQMKTASRERGKDPTWPGWTEYGELQQERQCINSALKEMRSGRLPPTYLPKAVEEILATFYARQRQKWEEDWEKARLERAATPVDDTAWEEELRRRARIEDDAAHPERFHHHV